MPNDKEIRDLIELHRSLDMSKDSEISRAARPSLDIFRQAYENSSTRQLLDTVRASESALRAVLAPFKEQQVAFGAAIRAVIGPMEDLNRLVKASGVSSLADDIRAAQQTMATYKSRFRLPAVAEILGLAELIKTNPLAEIATRFAADRASLQQAIASMRAPFIDLHEQLRSLRGFSELQGIGAALRRFPTFDEDFSATLRTVLGDWREPIAWPEGIFTNLTQRSEFYESLGFDQALTNFPSPAFEQSIDIAGLREERPTLVDVYGAPVSAADDDEEEYGFARTNTAHDWLLRLKTQLRAFLDAKMTAAFGSDWYKRRLPNGLYEKWNEKKTNAKQAGSKEWPLIAYADFTDYERVICRTDNWRDIFAAFFRRPESIKESLQRLYPIRLDTMHARPITQDDELLLYVETRRIIKVIK